MNVHLAIVQTLWEVSHACAMLDIPEMEHEECVLVSKYFYHNV